MTDWIALAEKHGARIGIQTGPPEDIAGKWGAACYRKGRSLPLIIILGESAEDAARLYCEYYHIKAPRRAAQDAR